MAENILMVSADRSVVAGEKGPFHYTLEAFSRHWDRIDVIGTRPERVVQTTAFGNVHLHHPTGGKLAQAGFIAATGRRLASERPYTVMTSHDYNPFYNGLGAWRIARATGIPWVSEIHHVPGHPVPATLRERVDRRLTRPWARWAARRAAAIRVVNAVELPALLASWGVPPDRIAVLPSLYLDLDVFRPGPPPSPADATGAAPAAAADTAGSPPPASFTAPCDILTVGRLVPNKGLVVVVQAVRRLVARGYGDLRLRIVGRGPEEARLRTLVRRGGLERNVEFAGWVPDAPALAAVYRSARVLVCASTSEGGPRVVGEAMACGTPVISTKVGIVAELVRHGHNGLHFDGRPGSLALMLQRLLTDAAQSQALRANLPGDLSRYERQAVIANLADGLKRIAASARRA